jgi:predicted Ser/Thr protein kinase
MNRILSLFIPLFIVLNSACSKDDASSDNSKPAFSSVPGARLGDDITLDGKNFEMGKLQVFFDDEESSVYYVTDKKIRVSVPRSITRFNPTLREHRAYQRLAGLPFLPHCYGKLDRHALLFEHLDAEPLQNAPPAMVPQALEQLRGAVEAMHERGILHNDLRHRRNILIDKAGNVRVIDFAGALYVTRGWRSLLFGWLAGVDRSAAIKWQLRYCPERISRPDLEWYRGFLRRRSFWPQWNPRSKRQEETLRRLERESPSPPR